MAANVNETQVFSTLTEDMIVRGQTPVDIEQRCLSLCQAYIGGSWCNATTTKDIKVKRITGGLTNQLYRVQLGENVKKVENEIYHNEPTDVAIKLFQSKFMKTEGNNDRLDDIIILTAISNMDIGPKVYGIFSDGTIQEFIEHEHFRPKHQQDPAFMKKLAQMLARIHQLDVPIRKNDTWPISGIDRMLDIGYNKTSAKEIIKKLNLTELTKRDLREEFKEVKSYLTEVNSPIVFSHNDYIGTNVLVTKPGKLVVIDFEYSNYFARASDIAIFHAQWGIEPFDYENLSLPEDSVLENFIALYIESCDALQSGYAKNPENCQKKILREVKLYMLAYLFYLMAFMMSTQESLIEAIPFDAEMNLKYVENKFKQYNEIKKRLINEGTIKM